MVNWPPKQPRENKANFRPGRVGRDPRDVGRGANAQNEPNVRQDKLGKEDVHEYFVNGNLE